MKRASSDLIRTVQLPKVEIAAYPCWHWCGAPGPRPGCHLGSLYGAPPTFPCLACGRPTYDCQAVGALLCSTACRDLWDDLVRKDERRQYVVPVSAIAERYLDPEILTDFEERAAVLEYEGEWPRRRAEARALCEFWACQARE